MDPIRLGRPAVRGGRIRVPVDPGSARRWLRGNDFWVEYPGLENLADLDDAILVIPALGTVATIAFALGTPVVVERIDQVFATAVETLAPMFGGMYPDFRPEGFALLGERVAPRPGVPVERERALLMFSGGVDSTSSLIGHRDEVSALLSVWGADVRSSDSALWSQLWDLVRAGALTAGRQLLVARSNMQDVVDGPALTRRYRSTLGGGTWWGAVQHGLALCTIAFPAAASLGLPRVLLASSDLGHPPVPWGSTPQTDRQIRWSRGRVEHDQPGMSRLRKIMDVIAPYVRDGGQLTLAVCFQPGRGREGVNCGRCEKCLRTATQVLTAGIPPWEVGLPLSPQTVAHARECLAGGRWQGDHGHQDCWEEIRASVPATLVGVNAIPFVREYLEWLRDSDLVIDTSGRQRLLHSIIRDVQYVGARTLGWLPLWVRKWCARRVARVLGEG
ncbi:MAG: hypothetical protein JXA67_04440 [Micromonosporaceae bacterium]|nr:hypothetical protein [Micromonosporaceae bacterium]